MEKSFHTEGTESTVTRKSRNYFSITHSLPSVLTVFTVRDNLRNGEKVPPGGHGGHGDKKIRELFFA
jgi:hypothetical protein